MSTITIVRDGRVVSVVTPVSPSSLNLTENEMAVIDLLAMGHRHKEIAEKLDMHKNAVCQRIRHIMAKLGCRTSAGIVAYVLRNGIIK